MDNKEATRTCGQCHKEVAEANFALHETHCRRFLCICPDCDETVPTEQLNQHREEQHTQVKCSKCNQKMERCHLLDHESDQCVERLQSCEFCELELPFKELDEHCLACGSRTELCTDCGRYVTMRDQPGHGLTCSAADSASGPPVTTAKLPADNKKTTASCRACMTSFPAEDIEQHEMECILATTRADEEAESEEKEEESEDESDTSTQGASPGLSSTFKATSLPVRPSNGPLIVGVDPNQISTCPHCHLALPLITLRWHKPKCQINVLLK
uniref:XIAP-associated factor 1 n=1 Tax=Semicossyphus pulcher TaxID=241346 RepID=UPI0037E81D98